MRQRDPRCSTVPAVVLAFLCLVFGLAATAEPFPTLSQVRGTPLPGPSPSAVAATPVLSLPAQAGIRPPPWNLIGEAEAELRRREEDLQRCRDRLLGIQADQQRTEEYLNRVGARENALRHEIRRQMMLLDRVGRGGSARLILTARNPAEAALGARLIRRLVRNNAQLVERYLALRSEALAIQTKLAKKLDTQRALERQLEERRRQLAEEITRHHRALATRQPSAALPAPPLQRD